MKIAMMTNNYKPFVGGVPISIERLAEGLRSLGHEVWIFAPEYEEQDVWEDRRMNVIRYGACKRHMGNGMVIPDVSDRRIREEFYFQDFDLIHVHQPMLIGNVAMHYSRKYHIPLVYTYHTRYEEYLHYLKLFARLRKIGGKGDYLYQKSQKVLDYYMDAYVKKCNMVFAPSDEMMNYLKEKELEVPVCVLPTGLSEDSYVKDEERSEIIRKKLVGNKKYLLCTVSRIEKEKNLYFLIDAVKRLKAMKGDVFRFMFVGGGSELTALKQYAKEAGLEDTIVFTGAVPNGEVKDYLFASDVFLFSSKSETQGIVLAEAMAAELPVVAVAACGVNDIVKDEENGCLTQEDTEEFATRLKYVLEQERYRQRLKEGAGKTALEYRAFYIAKQAEHSYEMAIEAKRRDAYGNEAYDEKEHTVSSFLRLFKMS